MAVYKITPTKANLLKAKDSLSFLRAGYDLLDRKRVVLMRRNAELDKRMAEISNNIDKILTDYYSALSNAIITLGSDRLLEIAEGVPRDNSIKIRFDSMMGVPVPKLSYEDEINILYSYGDTNIAFDRAILELNNFRKAILELAEVETANNSLKKEIAKTGKRANALEKVQIPRYESLVANIESVLEEKEREEFFRIKLVKKRHR